MLITKIAYLGLLAGDDASGRDRAESYLSKLAGEVVAALGRSFTVELISCGPRPGLRLIAPGVTHRVLRTAGPPRTAWDAISWELSEALVDAQLVHLHDGFSRTCEAGLLIAKQQGKAICLTDYGVSGHWLASELEWAELADVVICHAAGQAGPRATVPVEVVPAAIDLTWFGLPDVWPCTKPILSQPDCRNSLLPIDYRAVGAALAGAYQRVLARRRKAAA